MKEDNRLIDAVLDLGLGMKELREEIKGMREEMKGMRKDLNYRVEKLEKQQQRTNMELGEVRLTFIQYADAIEKVVKHEDRIHKLEKTVYRKSA